MVRFERKSSPLVYLAITAAMLGVFAADLATPLGVAVWVIYLVPVALTLFVWWPVVPVVVAILASGFMLVALGTDNVGEVSRTAAAVNRSMGISTIWITAAICHQAIRTRLAVRKQEWLQTGQTTLSDRVTGELKLNELGQQVVRFLCEYLNAHVGAVFVLDGQHLRRTAVYALPNEASIADEIKPHQGLVGQAWVDAQPFVIRDVPEGYLSFGSAMGQSRPTNLLIYPVSVDGIVIAVIELGFAHGTYQSDLDLLDRVGESIAVAFKSAQYRDRLQSLLEETQRQGEELAAQSEELRVNNEELEEQSKALKESHARLELQQTELEQTNTQLEEQTKYLEQQREDLVRAKHDVERQAQELTRASRYKSEFLANMSHELRTPLNSSLILAKLLSENRDGNLSAEQVKFAQTIHSAGNDLLALINDILDLSKIEAGRLDLRVASVTLSTLLENLKATFEPVASHKGLAFNVEVETGTPLAMRTDSQRLEQVLKNLLSNALKFTDRGSVSLTVRAAPGEQMEFSVRDTGIGISPEQRELIFEAFRQGDGTNVRKYGGTGLGLSISRELARLLGGQIELVSEVGAGSTFTLSLPVQYKDAAVDHTKQERTPLAHPSVDSSPSRVSPQVGSSRPAAARQDSNARSTSSQPLEDAQYPSTGQHHSMTQRAPTALPARSRDWMPDDRGQLTGDSRVILVIEDDESFARILYDLARELDFRCILATTAEEGLALAAQYVPSAILLDVGLPDQSGLSVLDRLKRDARTRHVPVHIVSGNDYAETAYSLGAIGYMLKPVKREELVQAFERLETRLAQRMRRVLIVEDDAIQLDSLRRLLGSRDVQAFGVATAHDCLEQLKAQSFDCMVLDLSLPDSSGFALLETLSREDRYSFPPVIVYTGRELSADEEQQLRRYSKSIIIKGAKSPERLLDEVTLFLHQIVSQLPAEHQEMLKRAHNREAALEGRRILVVEDDVRNVFALTSILEPRGASVVIARNGREALEVLDNAQSDPSRRIDLVLMDLMMPEMDGLTATREIRKRPSMAKLPVIALTAKAMRSDQQQCLEAGATDYMAKPLDVDRLLSLIRVWLPR